MKKTLALLICLAMLFTALSVNVFAAGTAPDIEIVTNSISAGKTTFAVKINGNPVAGVDIKVDVAGDDAKITGVSAKNFDVANTLTSGEDYKISDDKKSLHAVGLQKDTTTGEIISLTADATKGFTISVSCDIATSGTNKVTKSASTTITADTQIDKAVTGGTVSKPEEGYFIPYGSVYKEIAGGKYTYADKDTDGSFKNVQDGMTATQFKVPANGLCTFGISNSLKETTNPSKQFGNYTNSYSSTNNYGTMIIVGDWTGFKNWYLANKGYSDASLFVKVYNAYRNAMQKAETSGIKADYVKLTAGGNEIHVYDVPQTKVMWQGEGVLEYAVRVINNYKEDTVYSAAAYCISGETITCSNEVLTTTIGAGKPSAN